MYLDEMVDLLRGRGLAAPARNRIARPAVLRGGLYQHHGHEATSIAGVMTPATSGDLIGLGASPGRVEARVRIARKPDEAMGVTQEEVLVVMGTDFNFIEAMSRAAAVVTVEGGLLSHAAVVCRELRIPAVVGVQDALRRLSNGMRVLVDGTTGRVEPLDLEDATSGGAIELAPAHGPVGGKAENLRRMAAIGLPVSPFVVLERGFFENWLVSAGLTPGALLEVSPAKRCGIIEALSPGTVAEHLQKLCGLLGKGLLAVRSSALSEDGVTTAYAGIFETLLEVEPTASALAGASRTAWLALFSPRAEAYRACHGLPDKDWYLPLVVQRWVASRISGVAFTRDPVTGANVTQVELVWGACWQVVDGAEVDERLCFVPGTLMNSTLLSLAEEEQLQQALLRLEEAFGLGVDVEFGFTSERALVVHQVRPITTVAEWC